VAACFSYEKLPRKKLMVAYLLVEKIKRKKIYPKYAMATPVNAISELSIRWFPSIPLK